MEFRALRVPTLTAETINKLDSMFQDMPGITDFRAGLEAQELNITFDDTKLDLTTLAELMAQAGCPLRNINWVVSE